MRFKLGCRLAYDVRGETPFLFNVEAQQSETQIIGRERVRLTPAREPERWTMPETRNRYFRVRAPAGRLLVEYEAEVDTTPALEDSGAVVEVPVAELPLATFPHLYPSRYCQSDRLDRFARSTFCEFAPGYARVNGICNWIRDYVAYEGGVSDAMTSAFDTVTQRAGVCRDFAHLGIALCRSLGIPARYVSVYAAGLQPPDFHAVFEAYLRGPAGGGWYIFDPTRLADVARLVRIGIGRDAADVSFCTPFGPLRFEPPQVWAESAEDAGEPTIQAVRYGAPE